MQAGEACDGGPGCSALCTEPRCGDGVLDLELGEACDDGGASVGCTATCQLARCGDGLLDLGEACDEGSANGAPGAACTAACEVERCGDGVLDPDEACDDGARNDDRFGDCRQDCTIARCGDGALGPGESCDGGADCGQDCRPIGCRAAAIAAGWFDSYVLLGDGTVYGFGTDRDDALPTAEPLPAGCVAASGTARPCSSSPIELALPKLASISAGYCGGAGLRADGGGVVTWGNDDRGQRGDGAPFTASAPPSTLPPELFGGGRLVGVSRGRDELIVSTALGELWGSGGNGTGSLLEASTTLGTRCEGTAEYSGTSSSSSDCLDAPARVLPDAARAARSFRSMALGRGHVVGLDEHGAVVAWGNVAQGQLGAPGSRLDSCGSFMPLANSQLEVLATQARAIAAAAWSSYWIDDEGALWGVGSGCVGELGAPLVEPSWRPVRIELREGEVTAARLVHLVGSSANGAAAAIDAEGAIWTFGVSVYGALGLVGEEAEASAVRPHRFTIPSQSPPVELSLGRYHLLVRLANGEVWALGSDTHGQLGQGTTDDLPHATPLRVHLPCEP